MLVIAWSYRTTICQNQNGKQLSTIWVCGQTTWICHWACIRLRCPGFSNAGCTSLQVSTRLEHRARMSDLLSRRNFGATSGMFVRQKIDQNLGIDGGHHLGVSRGGFWSASSSHTCLSLK